VADAIIASLHLGQPRDYVDAQGRTWRTALVKEQTAGPVHLATLGPVGDAVANAVHHGGRHQAVMVYSRAHRSHWLERFGLDIGPGGLGENLSVEGLDDAIVCIGDVFQAGSARVQVSQPRQPCNTLARYWRCPELLPAIWETARSGWYFRVLEEGDVLPGDALDPVERPHPGWSSARVLRAFRDAAIRPEEALAAAELTHLTPAWQAKLREKAGR
jgi:MOSC domain-containing protein YiiM